MGNVLFHNLMDLMQESEETTKLDQMQSIDVLLSPEQKETESLPSKMEVGAQAQIV